MDNFDDVVRQARDAFDAATDSNALESVKSTYLGKQGVITLNLKALATLPAEERRHAGININLAKKAIEKALDQRRVALRQAWQMQKLNSQRIDISLPGRMEPAGGLHPITQSMARIESLFASIGFTTADGPDIESDWYNFTSLNMPADHPARSMHDTFYIDEKGQSEAVLLRTHTSPVQVRHMLHHVERYGHEHMPEIRIIAPGRVYRMDSDATHSPMFHQVEGLWVKEGVSFADLKGVVVDFLQAFFESDELKVRFRPSFFPFTEPSAEIDVAFMHGEAAGQWLEIAGCGVVHPNVLKSAGIDTELYTGFAFGFGVDRLTMIRYGIHDLRLFYEGDLRFLTQFS